MVETLVNSAVVGKYDGLTTAVTTAAQEIADSALASITAVVPIALVVVGSVIVVSIGIKVFKTVVKK